MSSVSISKPLSAAGAVKYREEEFANASNSYFAQKGKTVGVWMGTLAAEMGLSGDVQEEAFTRLAYGQDPNSGMQLIEHRKPAPVAHPAWMTDQEAWKEKLEDLYATAI